MEMQRDINKKRSLETVDIIDSIDINKTLQMQLNIECYKYKMIDIIDRKNASQIWLQIDGKAKMER